MSADLKQALALVERKGIASLKRVAATRPDIAARGDAWQLWTTRRHEVDIDVAKALAAEGAKISIDTQGARIRYGGISASSTMGLLGALNNWRAQAEKRLGKGFRP